MSVDNAKRILDGSGATLSMAEIRRIANELKNPEGTDQVVEGKRLTVDGAEAALWEGMAGRRMTVQGRRLYGQLDVEIKALKQGQGPGPGGDAKPLTEGNAKKPVFLNAAGWPVAGANVAGQPDNAGAEEGLYRFALLVQQRQKLDGRIPALANLPLAEKTTLVENAISMANRSLGAANGRLDGLTPDETNQIRSSAFTILYQLGKDLNNDAAGARLRGRIHNQLMQMADQEPNEALGRHMARVLDRAEYKGGLTAAQKADIEGLFAEKIPQKFDVANIMSPDGYIQWDHISGQGEGFFRSFVANLPKQSVHGAKFVKVREDWQGAEFELKFPQGRGEGGRIKGIRVRAREFNNDLFDGVGSGRGFSYGGHSQIGANQENSLARALARGLKTDKPQLCMLDLCAGLDNLDDGLEKLGKLEILTTFGSSYFWKGKVQDDRGEFDGVTRSEGMLSLMALFSGLTNEEGYEGLRGRVNDAIESYSHERNPNVVFPTLKDYREVRWAHLDGDSDALADANDVFFQFGLKEARKNGAAEFALDFQAPYDELAAEPLKNAVLDLNVSTHYNDRTSENDAVEHKFIAGGYFDGTGSTDLVRITPDHNHDGANAFRVEVNHGLAGTSREAMAALTQYSSMMYMADQNLVRGLSEVDRKLMSLAFATFRLNFDALGRNDDQRIWKQLLQAVRLPADLPFGAMQSLVDAEHHDYSGSLEMVTQYKQSLSADQLRALESRDVGRPGAGPPVA